MQLLFWLGGVVLAVEPTLHVPSSLPAPAPEVVGPVIDALLQTVAAGEADPTWLRAHVQPGQLSVAPDDAWYQALADALRPQEGALATTLGTADGLSVVLGPDYARGVVHSTPLLSVVVRQRDDGLVIDRIEPTSCALCEEPARFVRDLLAETRREGSRARRLLPSIDLDIDSWLENSRRARNGRWPSLYLNRNLKGGALAWWLGGAEVVGADGDLVHLRYADGTADSWRVHYREGRWRVDYHGLPESSPLRMEIGQMNLWRSGRHLRAAALGRWSPDWAVSQDRAGRRVGDRAIGASFDPTDGTAIVTVLDLDRVLSGIFRVDPSTRSVVARLPLVPPDARTNIDLGRWFEQWHVVLSPDGNDLLLSTPSRLRRVAVDTGRATLLPAPRQAAALAWGWDHGGDDVMVIGQRGRVDVLGPELPRRHSLEGTTVEVAVRGGQIVAVTDAGRVLVAALDGVAARRWEACGGQVTDAAVRADGAEVLVACGLTSGLAAERHSLLDGSIRQVIGGGSDRGGASWSPEGELYTTPAQGGDEASLVLWSGANDAPICRFGTGNIREVRWSADGSQLLTLDRDGEVWLWEVVRLRQLGL